MLLIGKPSSLRASFFLLNFNPQFFMFFNQIKSSILTFPTSKEYKGVNIFRSTPLPFSVRGVGGGLDSGKGQSLKSVRNGFESSSAAGQPGAPGWTGSFSLCDSIFSSG